MQLFVKKLRKHLLKTQNKKIRIFYCSEYGETTGREHYHAILFGYMPEDRNPLKTTSQGHTLYTSDTLTKIWQKGHVSIGEFNAQTADYCAKYVTKAYIGADRENAYNWVNEDGEIIQRTPPFQRASNRPGLGSDFYKKYKNDMYNSDFALIDGKQRPIPKAYDRKFRKEHPEEFAILKRKRNDQFTTVLNNDPYQKTKSFRKATKEILEQKLHIKKRDLG
jgi:hypothetical protein